MNEAITTNPRLTEVQAQGGGFKLFPSYIVAASEYEAAAVRLECNPRRLDCVLYNGTAVFTYRDYDVPHPGYERARMAEQL